MNAAARTAVGSVIAMLVAGEYDVLAAMTQNRRLTSQMLRQAVDEYGRSLVSPPSGIPPDLEMIVDDNDTRVLHAVMSLWTEEEGQSDLGLELTLREVHPGLYEIEVRTLHVL